MKHTSTDQEREAFEAWKEDYALTFEPNYDEHLEADCKAAFLAGMQAMGRLQMVPVQMPEPDAWRYTNVLGHFHYRGRRVGFAAEYPMLKPEPLYTEQQVRAMLSTGVQAQAVPIGWREQFATEVYADLEAADNQDVPLEEYPARILKVLDSIVGPRHPVVIKWRNDAIEQCIAIALKYCRDPESHKHLKQDLEAMLASAPAHPAEGVPAQTSRDAVIQHLTSAGVLEHDGCGIFIASGDASELIDACMATSATHSTQQGLDARDAAFEAVRKAFCNLQRYSFWLDSRGNVRRCADRSGNWVEFEAAHTLFEPQSIDAALAAQAKHGEAQQ